MNTKNYFTISGIIDLLFGISLVFTPGMMTNQYLANPELRSDITDFICQLYGVTLMSLGVGYFIIRTAEPSTGRKAFLIAGILAQLVTVLVHILAISRGIEKSFAWGTVVLLALMGIWGISVLRSNK